MKISVIIPAYNEEPQIAHCLTSLQKQSRQFELIVVDDGSTDKTVSVIQKQKEHFSFLKLLQTGHEGPAAARNKGANSATGEIYVFVDADMTFEADFLEELVKSIEEKKTKGTFTREEYVSNWDKPLARCWNYNLNLPEKKRLPHDYPEEAPVFRAILASEFRKIGGFTPGVGWTDDWTLSRKLGYKSSDAKAVCYHANPSTYTDVFSQAEWMGKNEFMTRDPFRVIYSLVRHSIPLTILLGLVKSLKYKEPEFFLFKIIYDFGITMGVLSALLGGHKNK